MKVFDNFKTKSVDELAEFLNMYVDYADSPWYKWYDKNYCSKCIGNYDDISEYPWCETHDNCEFFRDMKYIPSQKQIIKMWLESECG